MHACACAHVHVHAHAHAHVHYMWLPRVHVHYMCALHVHYMWLPRAHVHYMWLPCVHVHYMCLPRVHVQVLRRVAQVLIHLAGTAEAHDAMRPYEWMLMHMAMHEALGVTEHAHTILELLSPK